MFRAPSRAGVSTLPRGLELQVQQSECGVVCAAALLALAGARVRLSDLRRHAGDSSRGLTIRQVRDLLRSCGAQSEAMAFDPNRIESLPVPSILLLKRGHFVVAGRRVRNGLAVFYPEHGWTNVGFDELSAQLSAFAVTAENVDRSRLPQRTRAARFPVVAAAIRAHPPKLFAAYAVALLAAQFLMLALPTITGMLVDSAGSARATGSFGGAAVIYALVSFVASLVFAGGHYLSQTIAKSVGVHLGHATFSALGKKRPGWFETLPIDGVRNAVGAVDSISRLLNSSAASGLTGLTSIVIASIAMFLVSPWMLLLSLPLLVVTGLVDVFAEGPQTRASIRLFEAVQRKNRFIGDALSQYPMFSRAGRLQPLQDRYIAEVKATANADAAVNVRRSAIGSATNLFRAIDLLIFAYVSSLLMKGGVISLGEFVAASAYKVALTQGVGSFIQLGAQYRALTPALSQSTELYTADRRVGVGADDASGRVTGVSFKDVSFSYDKYSGQVLTDIDLEIDAGQFVVIAGPSGSGKTTVAKLIGGLETADAGRISVMGASPHIGAAGVSLALQSDRLIDGSIRDNVTLLDASIDEEAVVRALTLVGLDAFVRTLPMGLSTSIAEGRGGLSAGQRQRILLARSVVGRPELLVLDEATANIDVALEADILARLRSTCATILLITHRPDAWAGADRIFDLVDGQLHPRTNDDSKGSEDRVDAFGAPVCGSGGAR